MENLDTRIKERQDALKMLIQTHHIENQQTLVQMIKQKFGIETNQAVVSRDLRMLGINKRGVNNKLVYELPDIDASKEILHLAVQDIQHNEFLIVIDTLPGLADFVGDYLDMHKNIGILGVLAGENVIFITPKSTKQIKKVFNDICQLIYVKQKLDLKE